MVIAGFNFLLFHNSLETQLMYTSSLLLLKNVNLYIKTLYQSHEISNNCKEILKLHDRVFFFHNKSM